jgi:hypothetical protein
LTSSSSVHEVPTSKAYVVHPIYSDLSGASSGVDVAKQRVCEEKIFNYAIGIDA